MKRFAQQFQQQAKKERMTAAERFDLRERVTTFMEYHPRTELDAKKSTMIAWSEPYVVLTFPWKKLRVGLSMLVLSVVIAVPAFAEQTLPGDMLYSVKVHVNEEVRGSLTRTSADRTEWETKRLERRLAEARALAKAGRLTNDLENSVIAAVEKQKQVIKNNIQTLRQTDADEADLAQLSLTSMMEVQMVAFESQMQNAGEVATVTDERSILITIKQTKNEFQTEVASSSLSFERLMAQLERQTTRAYERLASLKRSMTVQEHTEINRRLQDIQQKIDIAQSYHESDVTRSTDILRNTFADVQKLLAFMNNFDVRSDVALERVVPKTLTFEERRDLLELALVSIQSDIDKIAYQVTVEIDRSVAQKVSLQMPLLTSFTEAAKVINPDTIDLLEQEWIRVDAVLQSIKAIMPLPASLPTPESVDEDIVPETATTSEVVS